MITRQEFARKIRELGVNFSETELNELFAKFDMDANGEIDYIEWTHNLTLEDMTSAMFAGKPGMTHVAKYSLGCILHSLCLELANYLFWMKKRLNYSRIWLRGFIGWQRLLSNLE